MSLRLMPLAGRWVKNRGSWVSVGDKEVKTRTIYSNERNVIKDKCEKQFLLGEKKRLYPIPMKKYHTYKKMRDELDYLAKAFGDIAVKYVIGKSVGGRDIVALKITEDAAKERKLLKPQVKLTGNIHGDEVVGRELLLGLARALCEQYEEDPSITSLLRRVEIHLIPSLNPDGFILKTRNNANDKDLNRGFPDWASLGEPASENCREPEVRAVMDWMRSNYFVLSLDFHDGWSTVTFPWDDSPACTDNKNAVCSEDSTFYQLALTYACNHAFMHSGYCPCHPEPITLGNYRSDDLEVVEGGMQDYGYLFTNCMELTVEVSCDKRPHSRTLATHWWNNYPAMLATIMAVDGGVKGVVVDQNGKPVEGAKVEVEGIDKKTVTSKRGEFWRLLLPGTYTVWATASDGDDVLASERVTVEVTKDLGEGAAVVKLVLGKQGEYSQNCLYTGTGTSRVGQSG